MPRVALVHWKTEEGNQRARALRDLGYEVEYPGGQSPPNLRPIRENPPDAVVIDLSRLPSHGREVAAMLRQYKATRHVPLVLAGGLAEKVALIRERLPDATYVEWDRIGPALKRALRDRPIAPVVPPRLEGYTTATLPRKLGIKPGQTIALINAPEEFEARLEPLESVQVRRDLRARADLILFFVASQDEMEVWFPRAIRSAGERGWVWIGYPKKTSEIATDLTQNGIREFGIALGWVDFKVCAIDETWTGLCFARRKAARARAGPAAGALH